MKSLELLKTTIENGPAGAVLGGISGWAIAKHFGFEKSITVVSFTIVGLIVGASIGYRLKTGSKI